MKNKSLKKNLNFKTVKNKNLAKGILLDICKLKMQKWKSNLLSQQKWFKKNIKNDDLHNCLYFEKKLIGYTCLRRRKFKYLSNSSNYLLFDTLIIKKNMRGFNHGSELMKYNNKIIRKNKLPSFLLTTKKIKNFYLKNQWKKIDNKFKFLNHEKNKKLLMCYNFKKIKNNYSLVFKA